MRLAVLGTDRDALALTEAALMAGHHIVWLGDVRPEDAADFGRLLPGVPASSDWELLLDHGTVDAVFVGCGTAAVDLRAEQFKRLVTDAVPLLVVHPASASVLTYYELDMGRRESHALLRHYTPLAGAPALAELAAWVKTGTGEIGTVHQVVCQRAAPDCGREAVLRHLARDVELLRAVAGDVRSVNAMGPTAKQATYASLQVQMAGRDQASLRWSIAPASDAVPRVGLTLVGERGSARLHIPADGPQHEVARDDGWQLEIDVDGRGDVRSLPAWNAPAAAIEQLAAALPSNGSQESDAFSTWHDATASMEVVDAIELSLEKGRTIQVHAQRLTEQLAFRGTMAALGCGLLTLGLVVLVIVGALGGVEGMLGHPLVSSWPLILLALLTFFLLLQAVPWLAAKGRSKSTTEEAGDPE